MRAAIAWVCTTIAALALVPGASATVGGQPATRDYPHMAALESDGSFICGGSLVAPSIVLTAAHCVAGDPGPEGYRVGLGSNDRTASPERLEVTRVEVHEGYEASTARNDVALLTLATPSAQRPIALLDPAEAARRAPGTEARLIGYGAKFFPDLLALTTTTQLQEVDVPIVDDATCRERDEAFDAVTQLCAGRPGGGKDACQGDSGGPLTVPGPDGRDAQVGVVSSGLGCGAAMAYGIYSKVADRPLFDWVTARLPAPPKAAPAPAAVKPTVRKSAYRRCIFRANRKSTKRARAKARSACYKRYPKRR